MAAMWIWDHRRLRVNVPSVLVPSADIELRYGYRRDGDSTGYSVWFTYLARLLRVYMRDVHRRVLPGAQDDQPGQE